MGSKTGLLFVGGAVLLGALLLGSKKASAAPAEDEEQPPEVTPTSSPEEVYAAAMAPTMTDPEQVQALGEWLVGSGQRPDLGAEVTQKATALRAEAILRAALDPSTPSSTEHLSQWAADLQYLPEYLKAVRNRSLAAQGRAVTPAKQTIVLLSGTGELVVDYDSFLPDAPEDAAHPVTVKPKKKKKTPAASADPALTATPVAAGTTLPEAMPPIAEMETTPEADPNGTVALARALIAEEQSASWRSESAAVAAWETKMGLGNSGKFGVDDAQQMANEVAVLPIIRFWAKGGATLKQQLFDYRQFLYLFADSYRLEGKPEHAASLIASAEREQGQGWPSDPRSKQPIPFDFPNADGLEKIMDSLEAITTRGPSNA
jgi:hypothetical protein